MKCFKCTKDGKSDSSPTIDQGDSSGDQRQSTTSSTIDNQGGALFWYIVNIPQWVCVLFLTVFFATLPFWWFYYLIAMYSFAVFMLIWWIYNKIKKKLLFLNYLF